MVNRKKIELFKKRVREDCKCEKSCNVCDAKISRYLRYNSAHIPMDYWPLAIKNFEGDQNFKRYVQSYMSNLDEAYEGGKSLGFIGNFGTGKTYAACAILKYAITKDYSAMYINMSDLIQKSISGDVEFFNRIMEVDFLCVDEYDSRWVFPSEKSEQLFGQTMERVFRNRFQNMLPVILCSNTAELKDVLNENFSRPIDSLFSKYLKVLYVSGKDFRKG